MKNLKPKFVKLGQTNRVIAYNRMIPKWLRAKIWYRDKGKCVYCHRGSKQVKIEYGHFIAFTNGGHNCLDNLQLECQNCNQRKGTKVWTHNFVTKYFRKVGANGCTGQCKKKTTN